MKLKSKLSDTDNTMDNTCELLHTYIHMEIP